ncbi:MAG: glycosyltransferase family 4 protein [Hyphomicrobium sp.]
MPDNIGGGAGAVRGLKVAVICGHPRSLKLFRADLLKAMRQAGHEVIAVGPAADADTLAFLDDIGVGYRKIGIDRASISPLGDLRTWRHLHRLFKSERPDCVLAYTIKPVVYGILAARTAGVGNRYAMITGLGYAFTEGAAFSAKRALVRLVAQALYSVSLRLASGVIFQNRDDHAQFRSSRILPAGKATLIVPGSGIDLQHFAQVSVPQKTSLLVIARLVAAKGVREYIAAARDVARDHPDVAFGLVGAFDPNPSAISASEVEAAVRQGVLTYHGETTDVRPYLAECSIYVLPSYREGMPRSVLEAMAVGRAVITTDVPGCRETVEPSVNGLLVPARNARALEEAMRVLIADRERVVDMGRHSRAKVERQFDARVVSAALVRFCGLETEASRKLRSA